jgi:2-polyprenyl-6-methoxyphenol hydroxylase-like FAD-dependent oxidoreductase
VKEQVVTDTQNENALDCQVLIVGAGPVGLVAACDLARRGVAVRIVDAADTPSAGSRAKGLQPRSIEVLDDLGVADRVLATGRSRLQVRRYAGRTILGTGDLNADAQEPSAATPYTRTMIVPQWRMEGILRERLAELGVRIEHSSRVTALREEPTGVWATVRRGGEVEDISASYLIGSDGASSTVRKLVGVGFLGETDQTFKMLTADLELSGLDRDFWHMWPNQGQPLALCPLATSDTFQLQAGVPAETAGDLSLPDIQAMVDAGSGRSDIRVRSVDWQSIWRSNVRMVDHYRAGRVFLAGDAAHVHSPAGGLGMNTGIQDAYNLSWKIAHVLDGAPEELLDTYEEERLPVAADVLGLSSKMISRGLGKVVPAGGQSSDTLQLSLRYPASSLSAAGSADNKVTAGDRAPDAVCEAPDGTQVRLFDLFRGPRLTALAYGPRSSRISTELTKRFPDHVRGVTVLPSPANGMDDASVADHTGHAYADYGIDGDTLLIIRPDGYVGMRTTDPEEDPAICYLNRLLPRQIPFTNAQ